MVIIMNFQKPAFKKFTERLSKFPRRCTKKRKRNDFGGGWWIPGLKNGGDDVTVTNGFVSGPNWLM